jgi:hypothetical protein
MINNLHIGDIINVAGSYGCYILFGIDEQYCVILNRKILYYHVMNIFTNVTISLIQSQMEWHHKL